MSKVQLQGNVSGTGIFTIAAPNSNTDRTLTLPDNTGTLVTNTAGSVTQSMLASGVAGNGPAFRAFLSLAQTTSSAVNTKIALDTEVFDTASCFNNTASTVGGIPAYAFRPNVAGYYQFSTSVYGQTSASMNYNYIQIYKNASQDSAVVYGPYSGVTQIGSLSALIYLNGTTDYVELYGQIAGTGSMVFVPGGSFTFFNGFLARAA